ncbi:MAG: phospholipase A [Flavobacterium sp.]
MSLFLKYTFFIITGFGFQVFAQPIFDTNDIIIKSFDTQWELEPKNQRGTFRLTSYKPIYITAGRWTSKANESPQSENPNNSSEITRNLNRFEAKFQLSFKTKVFQGLLFGKGDIWVGYTQLAHWQLYNTTISRAFREVNYEPEIIFNYPLKICFLQGHFRSAGIAINHQSNGRDFPLSRSWNRIIFHLSYLHQNSELIFRPWIRIPDKEDENPFITEFVGRGEITYRYFNNLHEFYVISTHAFQKFGNGSIQVNYVFPMKGHLRGHVQFFDGYGETLIDYNHRQTTLGIGISFSNW